MAYQDVRSCVLTRLYSELLIDSLNEYSYYAELAGLEYFLNNTTDGLSLSFFGYNEKMHLLVEKVVEKMKAAQFTEQQFGMIKERVIFLFLPQIAKKYKNWFQESPQEHAIYYMTLLTQEKLFTAQEKLNALEGIKLADVLDFSQSIFNALFVEGLIHGNVSAEEAKRLGNIVIEKLNFKPLNTSDRFPKMGTYAVKEGASSIYKVNVFNPTNVNSAIEYCIQMGEEWDPICRANLLLLCQLAREPVFDQLRTKEQLGYMVYSGLRSQQMIAFRFFQFLH